MSKRKQKLQLLKTLMASENRAQKLEQEKQINSIQTKLLEQELAQMKQELENLESRRDQLIKLGEQSLPETNESSD